MSSPVHALARLEPTDRARVLDIEHRLQESPCLSASDDAAVPAWLPEALHEVLRLELSCGYRPVRRPAGSWGLGERAAVAPEGLVDRYEDAMARLPLPFHYDPLRPEAEQRNRVRLRADLCTHGPDVRCLFDEMWPAVGLANHDQIRVLVSDDSLLLAWVGGFREEPFGARDVDVLTALVPALQRNLALRRELLDSRPVLAGIEAALAALGVPAFVVREGGQVEYANAVGAALLGGSRLDVESRLRDAVRGDRRACDVARLTSAGGRSAYLVVLRDTDDVLDARLAHAVRLWRATPREGAVLRCLVMGDSNKEIGLRLACQESTVERHVTSLLRKAGCDGRSRLIARFWSA